MKVEEGLLLFAGAVAGAVALDKYFNEGELTDRVTTGAGQFVTEVVKDGGVQVLKEVATNTREVFTNLSEDVIDKGKELIPDVKIPDVNFENPFSNLFSGNSKSGTTNPTQPKDPANGGLAGKVSEAVGLPVFFSGANNIKNLFTTYVSNSPLSPLSFFIPNKEIVNFNTKYGAQTYLKSANQSEAGKLFDNVRSSVSNVVEKVTGSSSSSSSKNKNNVILASLNSTTSTTPKNANFSSIDGTSKYVAPTMTKSSLNYTPAVRNSFEKFVNVKRK